jgi:UDPglucose--hexose-1-phosphate uridylyltransferase
VLLRSKKCLNDPAYNFLIHTSPNVKARLMHRNYWDANEVDFHWHIEFMPRLTRIAGLEWATGFCINPKAPEEAAKYLHDVAL